MGWLRSLMTHFTAFLPRLPYSLQAALARSTNTRPTERIQQAMVSQQHGEQAVI